MLTPTEVLDFELKWHTLHPTVDKDEAIVREFDVSPTRYYQALNAAIDNAEMLPQYPMLIKRLRRVRALRRAFRASHSMQKGGRS